MGNKFLIRNKRFNNSFLTNSSKFLVGRRIIEKRNSPTIKSYIELEYIQSSGYQFIDTNVVATIDMTFKTKFSWLSLNTIKYSEGWPVVFGAETTDNSSDSLKIRTPSDSNRSMSYTFGSFRSDDTVQKYSINTIYDIFLNKNEFKVNNNTIATSLTTTFSSAKYSIYLFSLNYSDKTSSIFNDRRSIIKMYNFLILNSNGSYILDLIPVKDQDGIVCMYDKVSRTFFYNQGSGEFITGPEV